MKKIQGALMVLFVILLGYAAKSIYIENKEKSKLFETEKHNAEIAQQTVGQKLAGKTFSDKEAGSFTSRITFISTTNDGSTGLMTFSNAPVEVVYDYTIDGSTINAQFKQLNRGKVINLSKLYFASSENTGDYVYTYIGDEKYEFYSDNVYKSLNISN